MAVRLYLSDWSSDLHKTSASDLRPLGNTGLGVTALGFGAFKVGRNAGIKYPQGFALPTDDEAHRLLNSVLDLGYRYIDTAPAYGLSEERIGRALSRRRQEFILSTKVGENFANGESSYDFSERGIRQSLERSLDRLKTDQLDLVFIHSPGDDLQVLRQSDVVPVLQEYRQKQIIRGIGLSGKTVAGFVEAMNWADVLMVEYNLSNATLAPTMQLAREKKIGVVVKKGLGSGHLTAGPALEFALSHPAVDTVVVGGLNIEHLRTNLQLARRMNQQRRCA